jgi:hypothetical protein
MGAPAVGKIDEVQRLTSECIELLRYLHDHPHTRFALLLVAGDGCWEVLSREPMLRSRIYRRVSMAPLSGDQVCELMGSFHPIYTGVARELLPLVDDHLAQGNLGDGASFTHTAAKLCSEQSRAQLDAEVVRNAFALHSGVPWRRARLADRHGRRGRRAAVADHHQSAPAAT